MKTQETVTVIYNQGALEYHSKVLSTPFDGSYANRQAKKDAANYIRGWIEYLTSFAALSDTKVSKYCNQEANRLNKIIKAAQYADGIKW